MNVIETIKTKLKKYPEIKYEESENFISVLPSSESGFTVLLEKFSDNIKVFYNGWHEDFDDEEKALNCFAFGLSNECRLKEFSKNNEPYKWTLEYKEGENWIEDSTVSLFDLSFWKTPSEKYLQNDLIK